MTKSGIQKLSVFGIVSSRVGYIMSDHEYFIYYKNNFSTIYTSTEEMAYIKDAKLRYQYVTPKMLQVTGLSAAKQILNNTNSELRLNKELLKLIPNFCKQDEEVKKTGKTNVFLDIIPQSNHLFTYIVHKNPIINPSTNNFVGIRGQLNRLFLPHIVKLLFNIHGNRGLLINKQYSNKDLFREYNLTNMQHIVLFLCLNNYSYTDIALLISEFVQSTTPVQVNSTLEELKLIFHVRTKKQLIEKAIGLNFNVYIPKNLFKLASINIDSEVIQLIDSQAFND